MTKTIPATYALQCPRFSHVVMAANLLNAHEAPNIAAMADRLHRLTATQRIAVTHHIAVAAVRLAAGDAHSLRIAARITRSAARFLDMTPGADEAACRSFARALRTGLSNTPTKRPDTWAHEAAAVRYGTMLAIGSKDYSEIDFWSGGLLSAAREAATAGGFAGADLHGAKLWNADLSNSDMRNANLSRADLFGVKLGNVNLCKASLTYANLENSMLYDTSLADADLSHAHLGSANLENADMSGATLRDTDLSDVDLRHTQGLTMHQLRSASALDGTKLPKNLRGRRAAQWDSKVLC